MTPDDFPEIRRDAVVTDALIAYSITQAEEYAAQHAPGVPPDAIIWLFVNYCHERDRGEKALLRGAVTLLLDQYRWEREHVST